jgi:hypothetical protein
LLPPAGACSVGARCAGRWCSPPALKAGGRRVALATFRDVASGKAKRVALRLPKSFFKKLKRTHALSLAVRVDTRKPLVRTTRARLKLTL